MLSVINSKRRNFDREKKNRERRTETMEESALFYIAAFLFSDPALR